MNYKITLHHKSGIIAQYLDLNDVLNKLGYSFILNNVGEGFERVVREPVIKGMCIVDYTYSVENNNYILLNEFGKFLTAKDFSEIVRGHRVERIQKRRTKIYKYRISPVPGTGKIRNKFSNSLRSPKTQSERRANFDNFYEDEDGFISTIKIRDKRKALPTEWSDYQRSQYSSRSWKLYRKNQYKNL